MKWIVCSLLAAASLFSDGTQPNPPAWPANVIVLTPGQKDAQSKVDNIYHENGGHIPPDNGQFSSSRYAILFMPGTHSITVNVGYYTSLIGLGSTPGLTIIPQVICENGDHCWTIGALNNFWRSCENFLTPHDMTWAVSQGTSMRKVQVNGNLSLCQYNSDSPPPPKCDPNPYYQAGFSSGGFMADCKVTGKIISGSQQQWLSRNSDLGSQGWSNGVYNMVFLGCLNAPASHCGNANKTNPYTTIEKTPVIAEKPYISYENQRYFLNIPNLETNKQGPTSNYANVDKVDFTNVFVATENNTAADINKAIADGLHVILCPGNYNLTESIDVSREGTCILGIGYPTLIATTNAPSIQVGDVDGVKIAGILLQAGTKGTTSLLEWGTGYQGNASSPGFLYDCFTRVGGPNTSEVSADEMVVINNGYVIGDNLWLWRADHGVNGTVKGGDFPCQTGIVVHGDHVTMYGLAVEHTLGNLTEWNGNYGQVYFYQSEYPYDVTPSYTGISYKVADTVTNHQAWGVGVYCYFRDFAVTADSGIEAPKVSGVQFTNSLTVFLNGKGGINNVINTSGKAVTQKGDQSYVCSYPPSEDYPWHEESEPYCGCKD